MGDSLDRLFVLPRLVLTARKIDLYDAINLVIYAKVPLVSARRGRDLVAGFIRREETRISTTLMSPRQKDELLSKYEKEIASFRYPVAPSQYEPLLEKMVEANEYALPYFFHEHDQLSDRRRRAAMFADLHGELAGHVNKGDVPLQVTDSEGTRLMEGSAWMTGKTFSAYLEHHRVTPWWDDEENLKSHARLERLLLSDGVAISRTALQESYDPQQLPSYLFGEMLLKRTRRLLANAETCELPGDIASAISDRSDTKLGGSNLKTRNKAMASFTPELSPVEEASNSSEPSPAIESQVKRLDTAGFGIGREGRARGHAGAEEAMRTRLPSKTSESIENDKMLNRKQSGEVIGMGASTVDNYKTKYPDFPKSHPITKKRSKRELEAWLELHKDEL